MGMNTKAGSGTSTVARPVLLAVDGDTNNLPIIEHELKDRYGRHYEIVCEQTTDQARARLEHFAVSQVEVALVLVGSWRASDLGNEVLGAAHDLHPNARRAVLISWGDWGEPATGRAIFDGVSDGRFDHYVLRPSASPDEQFHQTISMVLLEWAEANRAAPYTVDVVGESWTGRAYELRDALQHCAVSHRFCLANSPEGRELVASAPQGAQLPLVLFPDGRVLQNPTNLEISQSTGGPIIPDHTHFDVVIVGAGPAGLSAAVYGASEGFSVLVVDKGGIGGQATSSSLIRNYLGFPRGVSGRQLAQNAYSQAWVFGADFAFMQAVTGITRENDHLVVTLSESGRVRASAMLLAMGVSYRRLGVGELEALLGAGVYYGGSVSEAPALVGRDVFVVGGANSAGQSALHLAQFARSVTLVVRAESLREGMSDYLVRQIESNEAIQTRFGCEVVGGGGDRRLDHLVLRDVTSKTETKVDAQALFILIGAEPHTGWLPTEIEKDERGFILTGAGISQRSASQFGRAPFLLETSMPGVFAVGDVRHGSVKRVASAVGEGSVAVQLLHQYFAVEQLKPRGRSSDVPSAGV
jgi:thioredoxin reductase (NADPH)